MEIDKVLDLAKKIETQGDTSALKGTLKHFETNGSNATELLNAAEKDHPGSVVRQTNDASNASNNDDYLFGGGFQAEEEGIVEHEQKQFEERFIKTKRSPVRVTRARRVRR